MRYLVSIHFWGGADRNPNICPEISTTFFIQITGSPLRWRSQTTITRFGFFWSPTPLHLHFLWYNGLQKFDFFDHQPPSSCKRSERPLIIQFLWPRKNRTNGNSYYYRSLYGINWQIGDLRNQKSPFFANFHQFSTFENEKRNAQDNNYWKKSLN